MKTNNFSLKNRFYRPYHAYWDGSVFSHPK